MAHTPDFLRGTRLSPVEERRKLRRLALERLSKQQEAALAEGKIALAGSVEIRRTEDLIENSQKPKYR